MLLIPAASYSSSFVDYTEYGTIPFTEDGYVVQGFASSCEQDPDNCKNEKLFMAFYYKSDDGNVASDTYHSEKYSRIAEFKDNSGFLTQERCFEFRDSAKYSHAAGLAYFNKSLYLVTDGTVRRYSLSTTSISRSDSSECSPLYADAAWKVDADGFLSMAKIKSKNYLLVGRYCTSSGSCWGINSDSGNSLFQYEISSNGDLKTESTLSDLLTKSTRPLVKYLGYTGFPPIDDVVSIESMTTKLTSNVSVRFPASEVDVQATKSAKIVARYIIPNYVQGVAVATDSSNVAQLLLSTSNGDSDSGLYRYKLDSLKCDTTGSCPSATPDWQGSLFLGLEDLALSNGRVWTGSESSASYYSGIWSSKYTKFVTIQLSEFGIK